MSFATLVHETLKEIGSILERRLTYIQLKVYMTRNFLINVLGRAFKVMKNGVSFIVIAFSVAELFKILIYAN